MEISANTLVEKIVQETETLHNVNGDVTKMHASMKSIHLLSELWLEAYQNEKEAMTTKDLGGILHPEDGKAGVENNDSDTYTDGTSIFDF